MSSNTKLQTWFAELVPAESRGEFWGRRARVVGIAGLAASLIAAFGIDRAGHNGTPALADFAVVMAVGAVVRLWSVAGGIAAPFFAVYMLEELRLSFLVVTVLMSITAATISLAQLYWGRLGDHFGAKTTLRAGTYVIALTQLIWLFTGPGRTG